MELRDCLWAVIEIKDDGSIICPLLETGGNCEECYAIFEKLLEREQI